MVHKTEENLRAKLSEELNNSKRCLEELASTEEQLLEKKQRIEEYEKQTSVLVDRAKKDAGKLIYQFS